MNPSYVETFRRHRLLFTLPVIITTLLAIWFVLGTPKTYKSGASLWVDTPATQPSSLQEDNPAILTPAAQAQQLLTELLATRHFRLRIAHDGPLAAYLKKHPSEGFGPTLLLKNLRGGASVDDRAFDALDPKHVFTAIAGPQVLGVEFHGPTSPVAVGTVKALIAAFNERRNGLDVRRQQLALEHYQSQMDAASKTLAEVQRRIAKASSAAEMQALQQAQRVAQTRLRAGTRGYNQTSLSLAAARIQGARYQVIDAPSEPAPAVGGMKKSLMVVFAGLFVGALISFLGIIFFTRDGDSADGGSAEVGVAGVVPASEHEVELESVSENGSSAEREPLRRAERAG